MPVPPGSLNRSASAISIRRFATFGVGTDGRACPGVCKVHWKKRRWLVTFDARTKAHGELSALPLSAYSTDGGALKPG